ncbi:hypothetical protein IAQ61_009612 [Plenodomus lingam]|uniref:uncharacterized protein n=1 Tax=Leptosphaeria maculans TaxID=5022 RepID=UPI00331B45CD|nr:hypothetical protein IAQ61_009612 [Plenodomus lingam]
MTAFICVSCLSANDRNVSTDPTLERLECKCCRVLWIGVDESVGRGETYGLGGVVGTAMFYQSRKGEGEGALKDNYNGLPGECRMEGAI